jgi:hypothetical protein
MRRVFEGVPPPVSGTPEESLTGDGNGVKTGAKIVRHGCSIGSRWPRS